MSDIAKLEPEIFQNKKIFLAIPTHDGKLFADTTIGLFNFVYASASLGMDVEIYMLQGESHIDRARNICVSKFLNESQADLLFFLDSDITFDYRQILHMVQYTLRESDKYSIIGGFYPKKHIDWGKIKTAVENGVDAEKLKFYGGKGVYNLEISKEFDYNAPVTVDYIGTGCMVVTRGLLEKFVENRPDVEYVSDHPEYTGKVYAVFNSGIVDGRWLSEDYYFCHELKKDGVEIWLCPFVNNGHIGNYEYRGIV